MLPPEHASLIPLAAGAAIAAGIEQEVESLSLTLKWPNDLLLGGRKVGGVLLEGHMTSRSTTLVLGFGINVNQTDFPPEVAERATSLALEAGRPLDRLPLLASVLQHLETAYDQLGRDGGLATRQAFESRLAGSGTRARVAFPGGARAPLEGILLGIDPTGALRLGTSKGERLLHAGEVTLTSPSTGL
jgi:BirA family biotin operon repressor/biotin-[acetyl-CoA-carboxylase] ligase